MPKAVTSSSSSTPATRRYAASVEKGENAWRREWSGFMSGITMHELRKGGGVRLPKSADLDADDTAEACGFAYLFASPAEKKAARLAKQREAAEKQRQTSHSDALGVESKHQRAIQAAAQRGLRLDGMTRKEVRTFLHLRESHTRAALEAHPTEPRPHALMDERVAWYQQGPPPIDLLAEKLLTRKALKRGRQWGLRYNYLLPHPSWLARRAQRRRESVLVGLGRRFVFDAVGCMRDAINGDVVGESQPPHTPMEKETVPTHTSNAEGSEEAKGFVADTQTTPKAPRRIGVNDSTVEMVIQRAKQTTNFISSTLIMGPSLVPEETTGKDTLGHKGTAPMRPLSGGRVKPGVKRERENSSAAQKVKKVEKRSKLPSFEP